VDIIQDVEKQYRKKDLPEFSVGDTVEVAVSITEGDKERIQIFSGVVIAKKGKGINRTFTVRRIVQGEGVERTFPFHSPKIGEVKVKKAGVVRRAKLYYLRDRTGKGTRIKEMTGAKRAKRKKREEGRQARREAEAAAEAAAAEAAEKAAAEAAAAESPADAHETGEEEKN
jgi:large subunit ribosomal protein L19